MIKFIIDENPEYSTGIDVYCDLCGKKMQSPRFLSTDSPSERPDYFGISMEGFTKYSNDLDVCQECLPPEEEDKFRAYILAYFGQKKK